MTKNDDSKLMPDLSIHVNGSLPSIHIKDYDNLIKRAQDVYQIYDKTDFSNEKHARNAYRQVNKVNRSLNNLRKQISKPGRTWLKGFKKKIDTLIDILNKAKQIPKTRIDVYNQQRTQRILSHWQPIFNELCTKYHIQPFTFPQECLKVSLTNQKRNDALTNAVKQRAVKEEQKSATNINGAAVYTPTGSVVGQYQKLSFIGDKDQLQTLLEFAKKNNITLRKE